jgi:hypothetical protein
MIEAVFPNTSINQPTEKNMLEFLSSLIASLIGPVISRIPNKAELPYASVVKYDSRGDDRLALLVKVFPSSAPTILTRLEAKEVLIFEVDFGRKGRKPCNPPSKSVNLDIVCGKTSHPFYFWITTEQACVIDEVNFVIRTNHLFQKLKFSFKPLNAKP